MLAVCRGSRRYRPTKLTFHFFLLTFCVFAVFSGKLWHFVVIRTFIVGVVLSSHGSNVIDFFNVGPCVAGFTLILLKCSDCWLMDKIQGNVMCISGIFGDR